MSAYEIVAMGIGALFALLATGFAIWQAETRQNGPTVTPLPGGRRPTRRQPERPVSVRPPPPMRRGLSPRSSEIFTNSAVESTGSSERHATSPFESTTPSERPATSPFAFIAPSERPTSPSDAGSSISSSSSGTIVRRTEKLLSMCAICAERIPTIYAKPCGHKCFCNKCRDRISFDVTCPECDAPFSSIGMSM